SRRWLVTARYQRLPKLNRIRLSQDGSDGSPRMGYARHRRIRVRVRHISRRLTAIGEQYPYGELSGGLRPLQELPSRWTLLRHRQLSSDRRSNQPGSTRASVGSCGSPHCRESTSACRCPRGRSRSLRKAKKVDWKEPHI